MPTNIDRDQLRTLISKLHALASSAQLHADRSPSEHGRASYTDQARTLALASHRLQDLLKLRNSAL